MTVPVVLVHGFATSSAGTWGENGWLDLLTDAGRETVAVDLLGHGTAAKPHEPEAYAELEQLVAAELPDGPVDAIGFSLGARVLLTLATETPGRFRRILTLGIGANAFRSEGNDEVRRALEGDGDPANPITQYFVRLASEPGVDREALVACMRSARPPLAPENLSKVTVPVLIVIGDRDFAGPAEPLAEALPNARLVILRGVDHFATPKNFGAIDATLEFLSQPTT
jgi:pimeloyl-ACP methyl ester carboxylesterase